MFTMCVTDINLLVEQNHINVDKVIHQHSNGTTEYVRNEDAEQLFTNVFGVRPVVYSNNMYSDCGDIVSEYGTMLVIVGSQNGYRMIKFNGGDSLFMDVQGK